MSAQVVETVEEGERVRDVPDGLSVALVGLEIDVDVPKVEAFRVRVNDALKDGLASLGIAELELELRELGDGLDVCSVRRGEFELKLRPI